MKKHKNLFIAVEGGDGSGKTTQSAFIKEYLENKGYSVVLTREPGGTSLAESIRKVLLDPNSKIVPLSELFLYQAARAQLVKEIILPSLKSGKAVVCDRFTDSTVAYQGFGRKLDLQLINALNTAASFGLSPSITIYIDVPPRKGLIKAKELDKNSYGAVGGDRIERESLQFHKNVRKGYLAQSKKYPKRIKVIKMQKTAEETQNLIRKILDKAV